MNHTLFIYIDPVRFPTKYWLNLTVIHILNEVLNLVGLEGICIYYLDDKKYNKSFLYIFKKGAFCSLNL